MLFFENPPERALVVGKHLADALVAHLLVLELFGEELVLVSDFGFVAHTPDRGVTDKGLVRATEPSVCYRRSGRMTKRAVLKTYQRFLERVSEEVLDVVSEKAGGGLAGRAIRRSAGVVTERIEEQMHEQGRVLVEYTAARVRGEEDLSAYEREFLETNPVWNRYDGDGEAELRAHLLDHFEEAASDLEPLVASEAEDFWTALGEAYTRREAEEILDRHFSQAETFERYRDGVFSSRRIGDLVIDILETGEERFRASLDAELDRVYGE